MKGVRISPGFWLMAAAVWLIEPDLLAPTFFAAAVHEAGHVAALLAVGGRVEGFTLAALGAQLRLSAGLSYARELPVALAGPVCSLVLAVGAGRTGDFLLAGISLALGLFNLMPIAPLDGGRVVGCLGGIFLSPPAAERMEGAVAAVALGGILALGGICLRQGYGPGLLAMGLWLGWSVLHGEKKSLTFWPKAHRIGK